MSDFLTFRIIVPLPATVKGPRTRWIVCLEHYGKNGNKAALLARCLTNGKSVMLLEGREAYVCGSVRTGVSAKLGTIQCKILTAMAAQETAEIINENADPLTG